MLHALLACTCVVPSRPGHARASVISSDLSSHNSLAYATFDAQSFSYVSVMYQRLRGRLRFPHSQTLALSSSSHGLFSGARHGSSLHSIHGFLSFLLNHMLTKTPLYDCKNVPASDTGHSGAFVGQGFHTSRLEARRQSCF